MDFSWEAGLKPNNSTARADPAAHAPHQYKGSNVNGRPPRTADTRNSRPSQFKEPNASSRRPQDKAASIRPKQQQRHGDPSIHGRSKQGEGVESKEPKHSMLTIPIRPAQRPEPLARDLAQARGQPQPYAIPQRRERRGTVAGPGNLNDSYILGALDNNAVSGPQQNRWSKAGAGTQEKNTNLPPKNYGANTTLGDPSRYPDNPTNRLHEQTQARNRIPKPQRTPLPRHKYQLGVIIRAPYHTEDFDQGSGKSYFGPDAAEKKQKYISQSALGDWVHSKIRKLIVVSLLDDEYVAVPLYTSNGEGLAQKKAAGCVSVQDHRQQPIKPQGNGVVIKTQKLEDHVDPYHPLSYAHTRRAVIRQYGLPVVYEGCLDQASTDYLVRLWFDIMARGAKVCAAA